MTKAIFHRASALRVREAVARRLLPDTLLFASMDREPAPQIINDEILHFTRKRYNGMSVYRLSIYWRG